MAKTKIAWSEKVWNPLTGCSKIGQGCKNCYAEKMSCRLKAMGRPEYQNAVNEDGHWTGRITLLEDRLDDPIHWKKPSMIFVNSMSDLFHKDVPQSLINRVVLTMSNAPWHKFQVLTKRYDRLFMALFLQDAVPHIWIGFSICNQADADEAFQYLRWVADMGWTTWVSYEPALEKVDWSGFSFIDWMVCGGESGPGCRHFDWNWARNARDFCECYDIPFFMKQGGGVKPPRELSDFPEDLRIREFPSEVQI
jgi:protein gp37